MRACTVAALRSTAPTRHRRFAMETLDPQRRVVASIACGRDHTLALLVTGKVFGWGGDGSGRVPPDTPEYCSTLKAPTSAVELNTQQALVSVAAGHGISLGITERRQVVVWGANAAGIGGRLNSVTLASPQRVESVSGAHTIVAGEFSFGAIDTDGAIFTWGLNSEGALGRPTAHVNAIPARVSHVPSASQLVAGKGFMLALTRSGELFAWGNNAAGQLGLGHLATIATPQRLLPQRKFVSIDAGATHTLAVTTEGDVFAWGSNHHGQLGQSRLRYCAVPAPVKLPAPVRAVAAGMHFSLALGVSGEVYAWGWNGQGQLGLNDAEDRYAAARVPGLEHVGLIAAGETHAVASTTGALLGWGNNAAGQLGSADRKQLHPSPFFALS